MTGFLLRVSQGQMLAGSAFLSGGPGEEPTPKIILVMGRIQCLTVVRTGLLSTFSLSPAGHSWLIEAIHIPYHVTAPSPQPSTETVLWIESSPCLEFHFLGFFFSLFSSSDFLSI